MNVGNQAESQRDGAAAERVMRTNYVGPSLLMGALAERFERRGGGVLVGVSSVAGERGRATNYVHGSAKAGFTAFLSGLRGRLAASGVHVVTVKPGFVRTRMTDRAGVARHEQELRVGGWRSWLIGPPSTASWRTVPAGVAAQLEHRYNGRRWQRSFRPDASRRHSDG